MLSETESAMCSLEMTPTIWDGRQLPAVRDTTAIVASCRAMRWTTLNTTSSSLATVKLRCAMSHQADQRADVIAWLCTLSDDPVPPQSATRPAAAPQEKAAGAYRFIGQAVPASCFMSIEKAAGPGRDRASRKSRSNNEQ